MKIIEKGNLLGIDKKEVDALIAKKKFVGLNRSPRAEKVIVSLTSYKPRINDVKYTIYSLLNQTFSPDKLILWLDEDSFPQREKDLPRDLLKLRQFGLTIDWCENLRPYKKLIPALERYPDDLIVTADDDIFYRPDWLKILYDEHVKFPDCLIAHFFYRTRLDAQGKIYPFRAWFEPWKFIDSLPPMFCTYMGSGGGVTFKRKLLHPDILRRELFMKLSPLADDVWFWTMALLNGTKIKIPSEAIHKVIHVDPDNHTNGENLWRENIMGKQDAQLRQVFEHYPEVLEKLIREAVDSKPYISVVLPVKNPAAVSACLQNIFAQTFPDAELILINFGARTEIPPLPTNFHVINYPGGSFGDACNLGLRKAAGEYILFKDESSFLPREALDLAAQTADISKADVVHFAGHIQLEGDNGRFVLDDAPELKRDAPTALDVPRQLRAIFWLQNKLSRRLDTKIFRRDFLLKHGMTFGNDHTEFSFQALIQAEKYFIAPQGFCFCK